MKENLKILLFCILGIPVGIYGINIALEWISSPSSTKLFGGYVILLVSLIMIGLVIKKTFNHIKTKN
jgi:hypothetical protein